MVIASCRSSSTTLTRMTGSRTEGGQCTISRFSLFPREDSEGRRAWLAAVARHWNLDRADPR